MGDAVYAIPNFLGGEISDFAQGRFDKPDYRVSQNICLNAIPVNIGAWTRRPGTMHGGTTRGGQQGRTIQFDFEQASAVTLEFTDGYLRFRSGPALLTTNDAQPVASISTADPAVVETAAAHGWTDTVTVMFEDLGANNPLLQARLFTATITATDAFTLADAVTGATIDGSTLGTFVSGTVKRVQEIETLYTGGAWANVRAVQAETVDILLCPLIQPQALTVTTLPSLGVEPQFNIEDTVFIDGPYLDPFTNGVQAVPSALSGIVNLTLSFPAYSAAKAYAKGTFVTYLSVNYISLVDQNVNNTPDSSPTFWATTSAAAAINDGRGFLGTDTGRLVRLLSEPPEYNPATTYVAGNVVTFNPSGAPGASTYWQAKASTTGDQPGYDLTNWEIIPQGSAVWTWGRITGLTNIIDRALAGSSSIGNMTLFDGIDAVFDGNFSKPLTSSAAGSVGGGMVLVGETRTLTTYVGKFYGASPQVIQQATIYPTNNRGFGFAEFISGGNPSQGFCFYTLNLRAKNGVPSSSSDGTLLATVSFSGSSGTTTLISNDQTTAWAYVWIELTVTSTWDGAFFASSYSVLCAIAQISYFSPTSAAISGAGCAVEILGPPLTDTTPVSTWRLGVYSDTTGWPTCGTYHEGRLWLGGAIPNRFDASVSNGIDGNRLDFTPTNSFGTVAANNAMSYTLNSDGVNPMFWMKPDLQGVVIGTQQGEWLVQAPTNGPIAPTNIAARRMTKHGSENIEPVRTEHANLFIKRFGRKLMEYFADAYSGKFSAPNLAERVGHIVRAGLAELAYTGAQTPVVWARDANGALSGMTYSRTVISTQQGPDFFGWHRHALGSGRTVESICSGPSVGGDLDSLTMVTTDAASGIRHVEVLTDEPDEETELADAWFLDNAIEPSSTVSDQTPVTDAPYGGVTLNGLWHLNGSTVQVFAGGLDCGDRGTAGASGAYTDFLVTDGSCFVPFGDGIDAGPGAGLFTADFVATGPRIVVGFTYNSDGQLVRPIAPADTGARNGPALGKTRRNHQFSVLVSNTRGVSFGSTFSNIRPAQFRKPSGNPIDPLTTFSGVHHDSVDDDYSYDGMLAWRIARPWPANIVAISGNVQTQDR